MKLQPDFRQDSGTSKGKFRKAFNFEISGLKARDCSLKYSSFIFTPFVGFWRKEAKQDLAFTR